MTNIFIETRIYLQNLEIEEASEPLLPSTRWMRRERREEEGEVAEEWKHLFPAAVNFEVSVIRINSNFIIIYHYHVENNDEKPCRSVL